MELFGVGPIEFVIIFFVVLLLLGPQEMAHSGKRLGRLLRRVVTSPEWRLVKEAGKELAGLPSRLMREASLEDTPPPPSVQQAQAALRDNLDSLNQDIEELTKIKNAGANQE